MRCFRRLALPIAAAMLTSLPLVVAAQLVPGAPPMDWSEAQKEYRLNTLREYNTLIGGWHAALNAGNAVLAAAVYGDSAQLLLSGRDLVRGRDAIAALLGSFVPELEEIRTGVSDFLASDRLAYASGPMILQLRDAGSSAARSVRGQHVTVLVREGRRWRIHSQVLEFEPGGTTDQ